MKWGVFELAKEIHVCPIDDDGELDWKKHFLDATCFCDPNVGEENNMLIIIHHEEN